AARRRLSRRFTFLMLRRAAARWRGVRRAGRLAFLPPMVRVLSRWPRAPTRRLPSLSCWAVRPAASLRLLRARLRWFSFGLSYFASPASLSAMAIAWRRFLTLPARPLFSSPWAYSCMTRPMVLRWDIDDFAMIDSSGYAPFLRTTGGRLGCSHDHRLPCR